MPTNANYRIYKFSNNTLSQVNDCVAIEEPLEVVISYFVDGKLVEEPLMITMRTIGDDESLITGILFSEGIINTKEDIKSFSVFRKNTGRYKAQNSLKVTLNKQCTLNLKNLQRHFIANSSCGICGKASINAIDIAHGPSVDKDLPIISSTLIMQLPYFLTEKQQQFLQSGGEHASALFNTEGQVLYLAEDVGRHNALDKLIGYALRNNILKPVEQLIMCSGRLSFDIMQKIIMAKIGIIIGIGAPTSLAVDLAKKFDITIIGFAKQNSYNVYNGMWRIKT